MKHILTICAAEQDYTALASTWENLRDRGWQVSDVVGPGTGFAAAVISKKVEKDPRWQKQMDAVLAAGVPVVKILKEPGAVLPAKWEQVLLPYGSLLYVRQDPERLHRWLKKQAAALPCLTEPPAQHFVLQWCQRGLRYELPQGVIRLGSSRRRCHFCIDQIGVSREHAELKLADGQCWLRDVGSSNGSKLNGRPLAPDHWEPLQPGDQFTLDVQQFRLTTDP